MLKKIIALVIAVAFVGTGLYFGYNRYIKGIGRALGYYTIDINPSIELVTDGQDNIVKASGLNDDGKKFITSMKLKGLLIGDALQSIAQKAEKDGLIAENKSDYILVSKVGKLEDLIDNDTIKDSVKKNLATNVRCLVFTADQNKRAAAQKQGISVSKFMIMEKAKTKNVNLSADSLRNGDAKTVALAAGKDLIDLLSDDAAADDNENKNNNVKPNAKANANKNNNDQKEKENNETTNSEMKDTSEQNKEKSDNADKDQANKQSEQGDEEKKPKLTSAQKKKLQEAAKKNQANKQKAQEEIAQ